MLSSLRAEYGLTPADLVSEAITPREIIHLIEWLPDDSALAASVAGGSHLRGWTVDRYLLRALVHAAQSAVSRKKVRPMPLPRAASRRAVRRVSSLAGMPGAVRRQLESTTEEG